MRRSFRSLWIWCLLSFCGDPTPAVECAINTYASRILAEISSTGSVGASFGQPSSVAAAGCTLTDHQCRYLKSKAISKCRTAGDSRRACWTAVMREHLTFTAPAGFSAPYASFSTARAAGTQQETERPASFFRKQRGQHVLRNAGQTGSKAVHTQPWGSVRGFRTNLGPVQRYRSFLEVTHCDPSGRRVDCSDARCNLLNHCADVSDIHSRGAHCACPLHVSPPAKQGFVLEPQARSVRRSFSISTQAVKPEQICMVLATAVHPCYVGVSSSDRLELYTSVLQYWAKSSGYAVFVVDSTGFDWGRQAWWPNHMHAYNFQQECPIDSSSHAEATALVTLLQLAPNFLDNCGYVVKLTPRYLCKLPSWPVGYELHLQKGWFEDVEKYNEISRRHYKPPIWINETLGWQPSELFASEASITAELWRFLHRSAHEESLLMEHALYKARFRYKTNTLPRVPLLKKERRGGDDLLMSEL